MTSVKSKGYHKVYETDNQLLLEIFSQNASDLFRKNTQWDLYDEWFYKTTSVKRIFFLINKHSERGKIVIAINKFDLIQTDQFSIDNYPFEIYKENNREIDYQDFISSNTEIIHSLLSPELISKEYIENMEWQKADNSFDNSI